MLGVSACVIIYKGEHESILPEEWLDDPFTPEASKKQSNFKNLCTTKTPFSAKDEYYPETSMTCLHARRTCCRTFANNMTVTSSIYRKPTEIAIRIVLVFKAYIRATSLAL